MFNWLKSRQQLIADYNTVVRKQAATIMTLESSANRESYLLEVYRKQINQTGKAAAKHKRRAASYRAQIKALEPHVAVSRAVSAVLHSRDPDWVVRGMLAGQRPEEAVKAAVTRAFDNSRYSVIVESELRAENGKLYRGNTRVFETTDEEGLAFVKAGVAAGRTLQVWLPINTDDPSADPDAAPFGRWQDYPGEPAFSCPAHYYRLKPLEYAEAETPDGTVAVTQSNIRVNAERTPFDAMAAMAAGAVVIGEIDDILGPDPDAPDYSKSEPEWGGSGGSSGGAGASGSWESPTADFSDVQSSVSSTESTNSSND